MSIAPPGLTPNSSTFSSRMIPPVRYRRHHSRAIVLGLLLLLCGLFTAQAYQIGAETEENKIHLTLTDYGQIGPVESFKSEVISHPDWLTVMDQQIIPGRVMELMVEFDVGQAAIETTGDLRLRIEACDGEGQVLSVAERTLHLTIAQAPPSQQHSFRIDECCIPVADVDTEPVMPARYILLGNHPNPFATTTDIRFGLPKASAVSLRICDITGRCIDQITSSELSPGYHKITWTGRDDQGRYVTPGVYFYQLSTNEWTVSRKMLLLQ
jgi:FlgD Ig-like domain